MHLLTCNSIQINYAMLLFPPFSIYWQVFANKGFNFHKLGGRESCTL